MDSFDSIVDDRVGIPVWFHTTYIYDKMFEQFFAVRCVMHFRMELHAEIFALHIAHRSKGTVAAARQRDEILRAGA